MEDKESLKEQRELLKQIKTDLESKIVEIDNKLKKDPLVALEEILASPAIIEKKCEVAGIGFNTRIILEIPFSFSDLREYSKDLLIEFGYSKSNKIGVESYWLNNNVVTISVSANLKESLITPILKKLNYIVDYTEQEDLVKYHEKRLKMCEELENDITSK